MQDDSRVFTIGNAADYQVSKTDRTGSGTTNMVPQDVEREPWRTNTTASGNLMTYSENVLFWPSPTGVTRNSATTITFTAHDGEMAQTMTGGLFETATYTFRVKLRCISGNTSLILRTGATLTPITIDGTLTEYSVSFSATVGVNLVCGVRDSNVAGFGQIEITQSQIRKDTWSSAYVATTAAPILACVTPSGLRSFLFGAYQRNFIHYSTVKAITLPFTLYTTVRPVYSSGSRLFSLGGGIYNFFISMESSAGQYRMYTTSGPKSVFSPGSWTTDYQWFVLSATVQSSGVSTIRKNLEEASSGTLGAINPGTVSNWGSNTYDGFACLMYSTDLIMRYGVQTAAQQENHVRFLADRVGISV